MSADPRLTPGNGRVALIGWEDRVRAERFVPTVARRVAVPVADLRRSPGGPRDRQMLFGWDFNLLEECEGWAFGQSVRDGYCGYIRAEALGAPQVATHIVAAPASHLYPAADIKAEASCHLSFGSALAVVDERAKFMQIEGGQYVPKAHLRPIGRPFADPATVAQLFFGVPYLWGGNSVLGIDCSGLVQAALMACGIACPGDSDMQRALGQALPEDAPLARGDLLFWDGHVGICVEGDTLLHANAHHMAAVYEPVDKAIARIAAQGGGPVTARRRL